MPDILPRAVLEMRGYSTADFSAKNRLSRAVSLLQELLPDNEVCVVFERGDTRRVEPFSAMCGTGIETGEGGGFVRLTDQDEDLFFFSLLWNKEKTIEDYFRKHGRAQNNVYFAIAPESLGFQIPTDRYVAFCADIAECLEANYLFCCHRHHSQHEFTSELGLSIGLLDVYWVNVFGPAYVDLIGRDCLLQCPCYSATPLSGSRIAIQATPEFVDPRDEAHVEAAARIRSHIGERFFARARNRDRALQSGHIGVLGLLKLLRQMRREYRNVSYAAAEAPEFDWSQMANSEP